MKLTYTAAYSARGLDQESQCRLGLLGDLITGASFNVTGITDPGEIERVHFLDSLSLLDLPAIASDAGRLGSLADVGSGAGLPALILALALPEGQIVAIESQRKKCGFIDHAAEVMGLKNVKVHCLRAEEYGQGEGRGEHDIVVSRALAVLPVVAEYSIPLLRVGGAMLAMKGSISDQERIRAQGALDILGAGALDALQLHPFPGACNRWVYVATKIGATPAVFPRRPGIPAKRPLGDSTVGSASGPVTGLRAGPQDEEER